MNKIYYQALLAGAMSACIITPALSEQPASASSEPALVSEAPKDMQSRDDLAPNPSENTLTSPLQSQQNPDINETINSRLYSMRPDDLIDKEVRNSNEESVGKVSAVVSSRQDGQVHVVISSGGFLGIGATEYVVPLRGLSINEDQLYLRSASGMDVVQKEYLKEGYVMIQPEDRPISEFSAFEERKE
jgi:hypothetical protein